MITRKKTYVKYSIPDNRSSGAVSESFSKIWLSGRVGGNCDELEETAAEQIRAVCEQPEFANNKIRIIA
jgi:hypothetical protein